MVLVLLFPLLLLLLLLLFGEFVDVSVDVGWVCVFGVAYDDVVGEVV